MKKMLMSLFVCLLVVTTANAKVIISQNGKKKTLKDVAVISIDGVTDTKIDYHGLKMEFPQGATAVITQETNGNIIIQSDKFSNVKVNTLTVRSDSQCSIKINPKNFMMTLTSCQEALFTKENGESFLIKEGQSILTNPSDSTEDDTQPEIPPFVLPNTEEGETYQQQAQDAEENLSPSAPGL